eukprot:405000_1
MDVSSQISTYWMLYTCLQTHSRTVQVRSDDHTLASLSLRMKRTIHVQAFFLIQLDHTQQKHDAIYSLHQQTCQSLGHDHENDRLKQTMSELHATKSQITTLNEQLDARKEVESKCNSLRCVHDELQKTLTIHKTKGSNQNERCDTCIASTNVQ